MVDLKLNETPVRTAGNFNSNNIKLENIEMPEKVETFKTLEIKNSKNVNISERDYLVNKESEVSNINNIELKYGLSELLLKQVNSLSNCSLNLTISGKSKEDTILNFVFNDENKSLISIIEINAEANSKSNIFIKLSYDKAANEKKFYSNMIIKIKAKEKSKLNVSVVNLLDTTSNNFICIENELEENSKLDFCIVDFGGKNSITNYYSNLKGNFSENNLNSIYLGKENQLFDLNYIGELRGIESKMNIEVQGALNDSSRKHFKGTLDFKRGAKKAKGNENEFCILLSDSAKSLALPMLLCEEEDIEGNHSTAAGKIGNKELFYIMSRGFEKKDAMKLLVRAKFNHILETISNDELKNEILYEIDNRLN